MHSLQLTLSSLPSLVFSPLLENQRICLETHLMVEVMMSIPEMRREAKF
jgi:hypothetical protein